MKKKEKKVCRFEGCDTVLTEKTAYSNGRGGLRNECKEHHKIYKKKKHLDCIVKNLKKFGKSIPSSDLPEKSDIEKSALFDKFFDNLRLKVAGGGIISAKDVPDYLESLHKKMMFYRFLYKLSFASSILLFISLISMIALYSRIAR